MAGAGVLRYVAAGSVAPFVVSGIALALLAAMVGRCVDALGDRLGSGATGAVQSALGNLPELFVGIFALRAGLLRVVQATLVGSILANVLLVLGLAFVVGGLRHGPQRFAAERARTISLLLVLAVAVIVVPTFSSALQGPASHHEVALSAVASVVLLVIYAMSLPASLRRERALPPAQSDGVPARESDGTVPARQDGGVPSVERHPRSEPWPLWLAIAGLLLTSVAAAFVSDWFVHALEPAISTLHISQSFAGLVIVAIAGNAVENVVGVTLAARNRPDYAFSVILQSPLQIALVLFPALVLLSHVVGGSVLTLVLSPLLVVALALSAIVAVIVVFDGESTWLEGVTLVGLYAVIAAAFWWG